MHCVHAMWPNNVDDDDDDNNVHICRVQNKDVRCTGPGSKIHKHLSVWQRDSDNISKMTDD